MRWWPGTSRLTSTRAERAGRLEPGRLNVVGPALISAGGSVFNTGVALHRLGVPVRLVAKVGADLFGKAVLDALAGLPGEPSCEIAVADGEVTSYTIAISPPGVDRTFLYCAGANRSFRADDVSDRALAGARVFHFGYPPLMREMYADGGAQLRRLFERAHAAGPATSLDLCGVDPHSEAGQIDWQPVLANALPFVDVFAPSVEELLFMLDRPAHRAMQESGGIAAFVDASLLAEFGERMIGLGSRSRRSSSATRGSTCAPRAIASGSALLRAARAFGRSLAGPRGDRAMLRGAGRRGHDRIGRHDDRRPAGGAAAGRGPGGRCDQRDRGRRLQRGVGGPDQRGAAVAGGGRALGGRLAAQPRWRSNSGRLSVPARPTGTLTLSR